MNNELISIIVPAYNVEKYIEQCIDSILCQTYQHIEIILIDDGSKDSTGSICDLYAKKDKRIRVIHKENTGLSSVRNLGIKLAKGDYIGFVDSDDVISTDMFEKLFTNLMATNSDIAICNYQIIDEKNQKREKGFYSFEKKIEILQNKEIYDLIFLEARYGIVAWNKLYRRQVFAGINYPEGKRHEDNYIIHKILGNAKRICCSGDIGYFYRIRKDSITSNISKENYDEDLEATYERILYFEEIKEEKYLNKSVCEYLSRIISIYYMALRIWKNDKVYREQLIEKYANVYVKLIKERTPLKNRMNYRLFSAFPSIGVYFQHIILKFKKII